MKLILPAAMPRLAACAVLCAGLLFTGAPVVAQAIDVTVDISQQRMVVTHRGTVVANWPVSTARKGKVTPVGTYRPQFLKRRHFSSLYNNAPMPYSIFYSGNYAIHGTDQISRLGRPASAGCVRLHPDHARQLFAMVQREGKGATQIRVQH